MPERMPIDDLDHFVPAPHPLAPEGHITTLAIEKFGQELQGYRDASGLTAKQLSEKAGWSLAKTNRMEEGVVRPAPADVLAFLIYSDVTEPDQRDPIVAAARANRAASIDKTYEPVLSTSHRRYLEHEADATDLWMYDSIKVSDILQTERYAQSVSRALTPARTPKDEAKTALQAQLRNQRAAYLLGGNGPNIRIILDELAFYRPAGCEAMPEGHAYDEVTTIIRGIQRLHSADRRRSDVYSQLNPNISFQIVPSTVLTRMTVRDSSVGIVHANGRPTAATSEWALGTLEWFGGSDTLDECQADFNSLSDAIPAAQYTHEILDGIAENVLRVERGGPQKLSVAADYL